MRFLQLLRCVTDKASLLRSNCFKHTSPTLLTLHGAPQTLPDFRVCHNHSREVQACLRGPQPARRPPHSFTNAGRVLLKSLSNRACRSHSAQPKALKRPAVIIQQYRDRFHRPPALHIRIHDLSQIPHAPAPRSLHRTLGLMMMERI